MMLKALVYLFTTFLAVENAVTVFNLNRRSKLNIVYSLFALDLAVCIFVLYNISSAPDRATCQLWYTINMPFGCVLTVLPLHFSLLLTGKRIAKKPWFVALMYAPAIVFCYKMLFEGYFSADFTETTWGWDVNIDFFTGGAFIFIIYYSIPVIVSAVIIVHWRLTAVNEMERRQARALLVPYLVGTFGILLCPDFWYIEGNDTLNMFMDITGHLMFIFFIFGIRNAVMKHELMSITPRTMLGSLIDGLGEPVFIVSPEGSVICRNREADGLIDASAIDRDAGFFDIFNCATITKEERGDILSGRIGKEDSKSLAVTGTNGRRMFKLSFQPITNQASEHVGVMVFIRDDLSVSEFKSRFNVTDRQMEIIVMTVSGLSNREIADRLALSERTVENHLFNIYNKMGIDNKIELLNVAHKFNIVPH